MVRLSSIRAIFHVGVLRENRSYISAAMEHPDDFDGVLSNAIEDNIRSSR